MNIFEHSQSKGRFRTMMGILFTVQSLIYPLFILSGCIPIYVPFYVDSTGELSEMMGGKARIMGIIRDSKNNEPVSGVNLVVKGTTRGALTDSSGRFKIESVESGSIKLQVDVIGYNSFSYSMWVESDRVYTLSFRIVEQEYNFH